MTLFAKNQGGPISVHVSIKVTGMRPSLHPRLAPGRKRSAWVCLFAALLLWTPLWAAAWQANAMACCNGSLCAAHGGPKTDPSARRPTPPARVECQHQGNDKTYKGLIDCSLSCCRDDGKTSLLGSVLFVLPSPATMLRAELATLAPQEICALGLLPSFEPPSPPPRISLRSL